jgi:hypothetical protein
MPEVRTMTEAREQVRRAIIAAGQRFELERKITEMRGQYANPSTYLKKNIVTTVDKAGRAGLTAKLHDGPELDAASPETGQ